MPSKQKYYVVWQGKKTGVFDNWPNCQAQIKGYKGAQYMAFETLAQAQKAYGSSFLKYKGKKKNTPKLDAQQLARIGQPNYHSIAVDAASSGNPGTMEYRGVDTKTKKQLFYQGPFKEGTNNIGEFLALVHGLALLKDKNSSRLLYTDSKIAMGWVRKKQCNTKLKPNAKNKVLFELISRAEFWLKQNQYQTKIVKWETKAWGEIPADFGRK